MIIFLYYIFIYIIKIDFFRFFHLPRYIRYIRIENGDDRRVDSRFIQILWQRRQLSASKDDIICLINFHARWIFRRQTRFKERMEKTN